VSALRTRYSLPGRSKCRTSRKGASTAVLATSLYRQLAPDRGKLFFSPYSISAALAMCQAGASGVTRDEIETTLGHAGAGDRLVEVFSELQQVLASRARPAPEPFHLSVANALWVQRGYEVNAAFVETLRNRLGADVSENDFVHRGQADGNGPLSRSRPGSDRLEYFRQWSKILASIFDYGSKHE